MYRGCLKRVFDMAVSALALLLLWPLLAILAIAVRLESRGPAIFRQQRCGRGGRPFTIYKFRSMSTDPDAEGKGFEPGQRRRVTRVGALLRKSKLDELPQLFNVLKGDMSMVGPRPEVPKYVELYPERWAKALSIRPGLTDPASLEFRNEEDILAAAPDPEREYRESLLPRKLDLYESYVDKCGPSLDAKVLIHTFFAVLLK